MPTASASAYLTTESNRSFLQLTPGVKSSLTTRNSTAIATLSSAFFNKIKHFRRIATRYDKLRTTFFAALCLVATFIIIKNS